MFDRPLGAGGDQEHDDAINHEESQGPGENGERSDELRGGKGGDGKVR